MTAAPVEAEVFGLNKSPRLNLPGDGDGVGCAAAVACAFFAARCFAGVGDGEGDLAGDGDCACATQTPANPTRAMRAKIFVVIAASLTKSQDRRQSLSISVCFPPTRPFEKEEDERSCERDEVVRRLDLLRSADALAHIA